MDRDIQFYLEEEDYLLFRKGMGLRKYHMEAFFGSMDIMNIEAEFLTYGTGHLVIATDKLLEQMPHRINYNPATFMRASRDIYEMVINGEKLNAQTIRDLPTNPVSEEQFVAAMRSGILMHDSRGYHVDPTGLSHLRLYEAKLERGEV